SSERLARGPATGCGRTLASAAAHTSGQPLYRPVHSAPHPGQTHDDAPARITWSQPEVIITPKSVHRPTSHGTAPSLRPPGFDDRGPVHNPSYQVGLRF